jgi:hypothetical protein
MKREILDTVDAALSRFDDEPELIEIAPGETSLDFLRKVSQRQAAHVAADACTDRSAPTRASPPSGDRHHQHVRARLRLYARASHSA